MTYSEQTEKAVIWTILTYPEEDFAELVPDDFYDPLLGIIAHVLIEMKNQWDKIDLVTAYDRVNSHRKWIISSFDFAKLTEGNWVSTNLSSYIKTLQSYRRTREAQRLADDIKNLSEWDPAKLMNFSEKLALVSTIGSSNESSVSDDDVDSAYSQITSRFWKKLYGYSWWEDLQFLDEFLKWILKKRVYRIGAPSNTGKTQLIYNLIPQLLEQKNEDWKPLKVAFFTLENTKEDTLVSIMCNHSWLNANLVNNWQINWNWEYLKSLKNRLYIIDDVYELDKIFSKIISIQPDVVILDYITHVTVAKTQWMEKYDVYAERVPKFAKRQNIAWIDLSNLPKNLQTEEDIRSTPWFYWSSILMNNCDVAIHLIRNAEFKKTKAHVLSNPNSRSDDRMYFFTRNCLDLVITKNRWWSVFIEKTYWINFNNWWRWRELSEDDKNLLWAKYG